MSEQVPSIAGALDAAYESALRQWRADTPGCAHRVHLNNAGAALMPRPECWSASPDIFNWRARLAATRRPTPRPRRLSGRTRRSPRWCNASPRNMAIVANATAGFVQAMSSFDFAAGDTIVTSRCDYTSNQIQYLALARRLGVRVVHAGDLPEGGIDPTSVREIGQSDTSTPGRRLVGPDQLRARAGRRGGRRGV